MLEWDLEPSVILGLALLTAAYALSVGPLRRRMGWSPPAPALQQAAFYLGTLCALAALVSPLDTLGDSALFSAHMAQHMLLIFAAAPLWLVGTPAWLVARIVPSGARRAMSNPCLAFAAFNVVVWAWHIPSAYDLALEHEPLHILEHLTFIASAVIGWWPLFSPDAGDRLAEPLKLAYLVPSLFSCSALALLITLSSIQLYTFYGNASVRWGLAPLVDQQAGGLLMWLPGDVLYLFLIVWTVNRLFDQANMEGQVER